MTLTALAIMLLASALIAAFVVKEHQDLRSARAGLLDPVRGLFAESAIHLGGDGFPALEAYDRGRFVRAELLPDTMTIRRLPQLWLKVTRLEARPGLPGFAVLVRPSGADFYSLTEGFGHRLEAPPGLPSEISVRGETASARAVLAQCGPALAEIFADPKVKEVAVTAKGLRIVRQAGEGRRGEHLLLRQAMFDEARVEPGDLLGLLAALDGLSNVLAPAPREVAA